MAYARSLNKEQTAQVKRARTAINKVLETAPEGVHRNMMLRMAKDLDLIVHFNEQPRRQE